MRILTVDIGTGTQDILLYDSRLSVENSLKLIVPSPTMIIHHRLKQAARRGESVVLTGVMMGGGPSQWAVEAHLKAGLTVYATPDAARSFNDDLDEVANLGVQVIGDDEACRLSPDVVRIEMLDFDFLAIQGALEPFGVSLIGLDAVAVAVFDHGNAPRGYSDRQFRFDYLDERIRKENKLSAFAFRSGEVPEIMTRLRAVEHSALQVDAPLVVMDTAPAAVLGATFDAQVTEHERVMVVNIGNFHTLAFRLGPLGIEAVFEHHTGLLDLPRLESYLISLAQGSLQHEEVFLDHGHGALIYAHESLNLDVPGFNVAVTGPRRNLLHPSNSYRSLKPYFAVPFGDMMVAGCFGLLAAATDLLPEIGEELRSFLRGGSGEESAPWDIE
jgi:uncharacterized protein (DUF1786 family)